MPSFLQTLYSKSQVSPIWKAYRSHGFPSGDHSPETNEFKLMASLPALLRTLLISDGTVTRSLESYFWEPVQVKQIQLNSLVSQGYLPWLSSDVEEKLLIREVELVGGNSTTVYTRAFSVVRLSVLPESVRSQLESGGIGIGVLLSEFGLESYREILEIGLCDDILFEKKNKASDNVTVTKRQQAVYRTYRIFLNGAPSILITEKFPLSAFLESVPK